MFTLQRVGGIVYGVLLFNLLACGCASKVREEAAPAQAINDLKSIGQAYLAHCADTEGIKGEPPRNADDLVEFAEGRPDLAHSVPAINFARTGGKYVITWGAPVSRLPKGLPGYILGFEAKAPTSGGAVLLADGSVKQMTATEFAALAKAASDGIRQAAAHAIRQRDLMMVRLAYFNYLDSYGEATANAKVFADYFEQCTPHPSEGVIGEVRSEKIVIVYRAKLPQESDRKGVVLGYESQVPTSGGWVIPCDGEVKKMTAAEFEAAPKLQKIPDKKVGEKEK